MCMCTCVCIYIYIHIYVQISVLTRQLFVDVYIHIHIHIHIYIYIRDPLRVPLQVSSVQAVATWTPQEFGEASANKNSERVQPSLLGFRVQQQAL